MTAPAPARTLAANQAARAMLQLNRIAKRRGKSFRDVVYALKTSLTRRLCAEGYCVGCEREPRDVYLFCFLIGRERYAWHLPLAAVDWAVPPTAPLTTDSVHIGYAHARDIPALMTCVRTYLAS